jgi:DNA helicase-2/ATP-dependent DNA helicase PcrA
MVGDISQSIYGFNGSSSKYFANDFEQDFNAEKIELLENFRSSKKVIEAAKKIDGSFNIECVWPIEGEFEIYDFPNQYEEAKWVLEKIDSLKITGHNDVEGKVISDDKIAIIGRNRYVFKQLELLLKENKRPYILKASNDNSFVCESVFMKCFELGIKLIVNPKDKIHLVELSQELSIAEQINNLDDIKKYTKFNDYWTKIFKILVNSWNKLSPDNIGINMEVILKKISDEINENDILEEDKNLIYNDIKELINLWRTYVKVSDISNRNLSNFLRSRALGQVRIDSESGITLSTVHMSKGLEYDVVFIIGLIEGVFPDYRSTELKDLEEEKHNLFVAVTRSKRLCYLTYSDYKEDYKGDQVKVVKSRFVNDFDKKYKHITSN